MSEVGEDSGDRLCDFCGDVYPEDEFVECTECYEEMCTSCALGHNCE